MTLIEIHAALQRAYDEILTLRGQLTGAVSPDTAMSIGEALGVVSKAKALVGHDIDQSTEDNDDPVF